MHAGPHKRTLRSVAGRDREQSNCRKAFIIVFKRRERQECKQANQVRIAYFKKLQWAQGAEVT